MDKAQLIHKRRGRYLAQILEEFEDTIEPYLPPEAAGDIQSFKGLVRMRIGALSNDAADLLTLGDGHLNGAAQEARDRLSPVGRP